jgi:hypothetical protein
MKIKVLSLIFLSSLFGSIAASEKREDLDTPSARTKFEVRDAERGNQSDLLGGLREDPSKPKIVPQSAEELMRKLIQQISEYEQKVSRESKQSRKEIQQLKADLEIESKQHLEALKNYEEVLGLYGKTQSDLEEALAENQRLRNLLTDLKRLNDAHKNKDQDPKDLEKSQTTQKGSTPPASSELASRIVGVAAEAVTKVDDRQLSDQARVESQKKEQIINMMLEMNERHNNELDALEQKIHYCIDLESQLQEALAEKELAQAELAVAQTKLRRETKKFKVLLKVAEGKAASAENHLLGIEKTADRFHEQFEILMRETLQEPGDYVFASASSGGDEFGFSGEGVSGHSEMDVSGSASEKEFKD